MSTTFNHGVAMSYAVGDGSKPALVFEMQMGMIDRGAELSWISQVGAKQLGGPYECHPHGCPCAEPEYMSPRSTRMRMSASLPR